MWSRVHPIASSLSTTDGKHWHAQAKCANSCLVDAAVMSQPPFFADSLKHPTTSLDKSPLPMIVPAVAFSTLSNCYARLEKDSG